MPIPSPSPRPVNAPCLPRSVRFGRLRAPTAPDRSRATERRGDGRRIGLVALLLAALMPMLSACGVNAIPTYEEQAKAAWSQVQNQYQRRADLIPNLVKTVQGYAAQEKDVLTAVVEARAKATATNIDASQLTDPAAVQKFQAAQDQLSGALSRLLVTVEAYPDLKSSQNFLALQSQLEGTENRISIARRDYIEAVRVYNTELKTIPGRWIAGWFYPEAKPMEAFTATTGSEAPPQVDFGK